MSPLSGVIVGAMFLGMIALLGKSSTARGRESYLDGEDAEESVTTYDLDADLKLRTLGALPFEEAEVLVRERCAAAAHSYERGEEAVSAKVIGFTRDDDDFIEVHCLKPAFHQIRAGRTITGEAWEETIETDSVLALLRVVERYFEGLGPFADYWAALPNKRSVR